MSQNVAKPYFAADPGQPLLCAECTCGVVDLKKPHAPNCRFGKPLGPRDGHFGMKCEPVPFLSSLREVR